MQRKIIRVVRLGGGLTLISVGVIGGFIPILQGWVFVIAGLTLVAPESRRATRLLAWVKERVGVTRKDKDRKTEDDK